MRERVFMEKHQSSTAELRAVDLPASRVIHSTSTSVHSSTR